MPKASAPKAPCVAVAVAADHRHAGLGETLFRSDDMDGALSDVGHRVVRHAELADVALQRLDLMARFGIGDAGAAVGRRHIVIGHGDRRQRPAHLAPGSAQPSTCELVTSWWWQSTL